MRGLEPGAGRSPSRIKGRPALEKSLHALHRRCFRMARGRRLSSADYAYVLRVASALQGLLNPSPGGSPHEEQ